MKDWYKEDLAYIHDMGFRDYALNSAPGILDILRNHNIKEGLIVDLGCGSGLSAREFIKAGYRVLGIDISPAMIDIARKKVPEAEFRVSSFFHTEIPSCMVVTSIGECLNYLFDEQYNSETLTILFDRIFQALIPGGIFIFDLLKPVSTAITQTFREGKDWIVLVEKSENREQKKLTRRIISLRKVGDYYRRDEEIHHVRLYEPLGIVEQLSKVGFQVETMGNYGNFKLTPSHTVFIGYKKI